jgi:hypothetical protein
MALELRKQGKVVIVGADDAPGRIGAGKNTDALNLTGLFTEKSFVVVVKINGFSVPFAVAGRTAAQNNYAAAPIERIW